MSRLVIALAFLCFAPVCISADELCPGCNGTGRVGCPACAEPFGVVWVGKCRGCQGPWAQNRGHCNRCGGTGTCPDCHGNGQACMGCDGSGRVPDGTAGRARERKEREAKEAVAAAMKPLKFTIGAWKGQGVDPEKKKYTTQGSWERALGDWYHLSIDRTTKEGKTTESTGFLTYNRAHESYRYYLFFETGRCSMLSGEAARDGRSLLFPFQGADGRDLRWVMALDPDAKKVATGLQAMTEGEWETISEDVSERVADAPLRLSKTEPAKELENLDFLPGSWEEETRFEGRTEKQEYVFESILNGHWLRCAGKTDSREFVGMLTFLPEQKEYEYIIFHSDGDITVYSGRAKNGRTIEFTPQGKEGVRWTWKLDPDKGRVKELVEVDDGEGGWKVVAESEAVRK